MTQLPGSVKNLDTDTDLFTIIQSIVPSAFHRSFGRSVIAVARQRRVTRRSSVATAILSSSRSSNLTPRSNILVSGTSRSRRDLDQENKMSAAIFPSQSGQ